MIDTIETPFKRLLDAMDGTSMPGAACVGLWALFDPPPRGEPPAATLERHTASQAICAACPALERCRDWLDQLPPNQRPPGVVAGTVVTQ